MKITKIKTKNGELGSPVTIELDAIVERMRSESTREAVREIARQAIARKCGARGLRAIIEDCMLDTMFELPGMADVNECIITKEAVSGGKPTLISGVGKRTARRAEKKTDETDAS